jgi:molybdopterin converting factor small subunit
MKILAFSIARDRAGFAEMEIPVNPTDTPRTILSRIAPHLAIGDLRAAVDYEYWDWDHPVGPARELALIPAVSGG